MEDQWQRLTGKVTSGDLLWVHDTTPNSTYTCSELICPDYKANYNHSASFVKDFIIIIGGRLNKTALSNQVSIFDMKKSVWHCIDCERVLPLLRNAHSACITHKNKIIVHGGYRTATLNDTIMLRLEKNAPEHTEVSLEYKQLNIQNDPRPARYGHTAELYKDKMYIFGGFNENRLVTNDLFMLDLDQLKWSVCHTTGTKPCARSDHCSVLYNTRMYLFAGRLGRKEGQDKFNDLYVLDLGSHSWTHLNPAGLRPSPVSSGWAHVKNGEIIILGGSSDTSNFSSCFKYNIATNTWHLIPYSDKDFKPRSCLQAAEFEDKIIVFGGKGNSGCVRELRAYSIPEEIEQTNQKNSWKDLQTMLLNKSYSDVCFKIKDEEFPCHKVILATRCKYFANMFESNMSETHASNIEITDIAPITFKALLEFIYCEKTDLTEKIAIDLLELSNKYCFQDLLTVCEDFLATNISRENVLEVASIAESLDSQKLLDSVFEFVCKNIRYFRDTGTLQKFSKTILTRIITGLLC